MPQQIVLGGPAGAGIMSAGLLLSKTLVKSGYFVWDFQEYPSLIKGGNNSYFINFSDRKIRSAGQNIDILICLDDLTWKIHEKNLSENAVVLYNSNKMEQGQTKKIKFIPIPASAMVKKISAPEITVNNLMLGAVCKILGLDVSILNEYIAKTFNEKHKDLVDENIKIINEGYVFPVGDDLRVVPQNGQTGRFVPTETKNHVILSGNEAAALAVIAADCRFFAAYPMTPASTILHFLASKQEQTNMIVKHPEDEIAAINMCVGAAFAGVRSATATSGGGYALMVEGVGLAGMVETPVVIFMGMRTGPSTGLPTYTGQGDLNFIVNTSHGEFPRVVICPGDMEEMFYLTRRAFNIADLLQTPVFILFDKMLAESHESVVLNEEGEHKIPVLRFGSKNWQRLINSYEHDKKGFSTEDADTTRKQMERRMRKYDLLFEHREETGLHMTKYISPDQNPDLLIVSWGSNKGAILDAMDAMPDKKIGFLQIVCAEPFDTKTVKKYLQSAKKVVGIECNYQGQMLNIVEAKTGVPIANRLLKYDGRQFLVDEIKQFLISNF